MVTRERGTVKTLVLDIETRPNLVWCWGLWKQTVGINQIAESGDVMMVGVKWHGQGKRSARALQGDGMVEETWALLDEADAIVHYNGTSFDMPHLNRMFAEHGLTPPSPYAQIDLLRVVRRCFRFPSNKLDYVAQQLLGKRKVQHDGFDLWKRCMAGDPKAWAQMSKYCIGDVNLTDELYEYLLPWIDNHPVISLYDGSGNEVISCPNCASRDAQRRGMGYTRLGAYHRYHCQKCGRWFRGGTRVGTVIGR